MEAGEEKNSEIYVQALARGLTLLSLFDVEHPKWSLGELSQHTGISKTTAYRMLRTLEWKGFLTFEPDSELYHIGPATIPVAYLALSNVGLSRLAHPALEKLAAATGETVELAVQGKEGAVVVDHVVTSHPFKPNLPLGRVLRNLANSGAKVLAAYQPAEERERILLEQPVALTPHTIINAALLRAELDNIAKVGLAFDREEQDLGVCAVSAPVFSTNGEVEAAVTVVVPADRFDPEDQTRNAEAVKATAAELSVSLGKPAPPPQP